MSHENDPIPEWLPGVVLRCVDAKRQPRLKVGGTYIVVSEPDFLADIGAPAVLVKPLDAPHLRTSWNEAWLPCWRFEPVE